MEEKPQILEWTAPECAYRVTVPAPVINEIRILAVEAFYSVPRGGVEIGGVFFGEWTQNTLHIRAHRPISCQYSTGPSFTLSVKDQLGLSGLLDAAQSDSDLAGMRPLGWYHSHTRSDIFLSPADLQIYNDFFPEKWQIAMVLRPVNLQPTRAGFFFRDRAGVVKCDAPIREYKLEPPTFGLKIVDSEAAEVVREAAAAPTPVAPAEAVLPTGSGTAAKPAPIAAPPAPAEEPPPVDFQIPHFLSEPAPVKQRDTRRAWVLLAVLLICGMGGAAGWKWGRLAQPAELGLETYDINGNFLVRWDRDSAAVLGATRANLEIQDGGERTSVELSHADLSIGGYPYMRRTGEVSVHMKVEGRQPAEEYCNFTSSQSLGSQPAPASDKDSPLAKALAEKEHLKTELINESMQTLELRHEITELRQQLAEERAKNTAPRQ